MKTKNLLFSGAIALSTILSPTAALLNSTPVLAETVSIEEGDWGTNHTFKAYQVFSGSQGENGVLGNIVWGDGVDGDAIINEINESTDSELANLKKATSAADLASKLAANQTAAKEFAKVVSKHTVADKGKEIKVGENENLTAGYYLIVDTTNLEGKDDVNGLSILQLTGTEDHIIISPKNGNPTPDKEVQDETTEGTQGVYTWGETADHDLNEVFKFKLEANNFTVADIDAYDTYYLQFVDTFSEGVTYVGEPTVTIKVGGTTTSIPALNEAGDNGGYKLVETKDKNEVTTGITVEIQDIKRFIPADASGEIVVKVTYNAKLNEKAVVNEESGAIGNDNTVKLIYSNNPNTNGKGESEEDKVFVASFKITNTKKALSETGANLAGAGFKLTRVNGTQKQVATFDSNNKLTGWVDYTNDSDLTIKGENAKGTEIVTGEDGDFSMTGLDAGSYKLVETTTPDGYNTADETTVTISATHEEASNGKFATVTIDKDSSMNNVVVNTQNGTLPETGGMGTTMMYTTGAVLVAGAAVAYVTNKRMKRED